jgi:sulfate adenylyltransferase
MTDCHLTRDQYLELEKIGLGAFRPLNGFMREDEFNSVVDNLRLPNGEVFPLPVVLDIDAGTASHIRGRPLVSLIYDGVAVGELVPESIFSCDKPQAALKIFGTNDMAHPGVRNFVSGGDLFVGGPIALKRRAAFDISQYELTPEQTKAEFSRRGWRTVVGFQTRNVPHRSHEYLQRVALEQADGLFIQPLVGRKRANDYTPASIMTGYQTLISQFYPPDRVLLGILSTAMRYAGPREAMFHAIIRRNYGCTHFIIGRDHAGVGSYYGKYQAHELVRRYETELGIGILFLHGPYHCRRCDGIVTEQTCPHLITEPGATTEISGTMMRSMLSGGRAPEAHLMRPEIVNSLRGIQLFIQENEL